MRQVCQARWSGDEIVVRLNQQDADRIHAALIRRVIFVERGTSPSSASDHAFAILELDDELILFPAYSGFAGLVHFERQAFWAEHPCVYWSQIQGATLPARCLSTRWLLRRGSPIYMRLPKAELQPVIDQWVIEGPQTWSERRMQRIEGDRPFATGARPSAIPYLARKRA